MSLSIRMVCDPDHPDDIIELDDAAIGINMFHLAKVHANEISERARDIRDRCLIRASGKMAELEFETSTFWLTTYIGKNISREELEIAFLSNLRVAVARLASTFHTNSKTVYPDKWPNWNFHPKGLVRWGIVELRVVENYLTDRDALRSAVGSIVSSLSNEDSLYERGSPSSFLSADDIEWNVRALMTNAGMYLSSNPEEAWHCIAAWCEKYISAITSFPLASVPPGYPFFFNIQRAIWETSGLELSYVQHPSAFDFYRFAEGKKVVVVSPLASSITAQMQSGNIRRLFKDSDIPEFFVDAIEAPVSTFPNRPHGDWLESFNLLTEQIDSAFSKGNIKAFAASCGAYGLPLCDHVSKVHGVPVFYVGNILHAYFGILQNATLDFMKPQRNDAAWVKGDLERIKNIERIDGGRYL